MKKLSKKMLELLLPLALGGFVLYWVYRDFDFAEAGSALGSRTEWAWLLLSLLPGVLAQVLRGWRWKSVLEPLGMHPRRSDCVNAVFVSYAASLLVPRLGEISRCGMLARYDGVSFSKSLGTVVTERLVDALIVLALAVAVVLCQFPVFLTFVEQTGTKIPSLLHLLTSVWFYIVLFCTAGVLAVAYRLRKMFFFYEKVKSIVHDLWEGIASLRRVRSLPLFVCYTVAIWACYYLHFYLTFSAFGFTAHLGWMAGLVMFVAGTFAVIVPTPNGAGPWHFAVITMMMLYGVESTDAALFALIVHGIQTLLLILLGIYGLAALPLARQRKKTVTNFKTS